MSNGESSPSPSPPTEPAPPSPSVRLLTSWKLWTLLLLLSVVGIGVALTLPIVHRIRALRYFDKHGAFDMGTYPAGYELSEVHADWPKKYGEWINALRDIDSVYDMRTTDESLRHLSVLSDTKMLVLMEDALHPMTARSWGNLSSFARLEQVFLSGQGFTDERIAELLSRAPQLRHIQLMDTGAGKDTMAAIACIPSVRELYIMSSPVDDEAFLDLPSLPLLERFCVTGAGDECAAWLAKCPMCTKVVISESALSDAGLQRLAAAPSVVSLSLSAAAFTDAGLQHLGSLTSLAELGVHACPGLTASGISRLPVLPGLRELSLPQELLTLDSIARLREMPLLSKLEVSGSIADREIRQQAVVAWDVNENSFVRSAEAWSMIRAGLLGL